MVIDKGDVTLGHGHGYSSSIDRANVHSGLVVSFSQNRDLLRDNENQQIQVNAKASPIHIAL
jgi:hypothetical protein